MFLSRTLHSIVLFIVFFMECTGVYASEYDLSEFDLPLLEADIPVVLSAARLKQPRAEVPASVTVRLCRSIIGFNKVTPRFLPKKSFPHIGIAVFIATLER